jgi:hypothetical protein
VCAAEIVAGELVISGGDAPPVLEAAPMRFYDWSSARSADAAKKSAVAKPSVNRSSTGANSSYASEERFWSWWKWAQLVAVLSSQARAPCACASSSDLRKSASADIILSGPSPFKTISAVERSVSAAHQTLRPCSARATASEVTNSSESVLIRSRNNDVNTAAPGKRSKQNVDAEHPFGHGHELMLSYNGSQVSD